MNHGVKQESMTDDDITYICRCCDEHFTVTRCQGRTKRFSSRCQHPALEGEMFCHQHTSQNGDA